MTQYINEQGEHYNGKSVVYDGRLYISPSEDILLAAGYHEVVDPTPDPVEIAKALKLEEIEIHDSSMEEFSIMGQTMWLGHELRQQLKTSVEAYISLGQQTVTKWFNGQQFTFPTGTWLQMLASLEIYAAEVLNTTESHKAAVNAMSTVEDIEAYDITAGYPQKLNF